MDPIVLLVFFLPVVLVLAYAGWTTLHPVRYCSRCGSALVEKEWRTGFDVRTGRPRYEIFMGCPNGKSVPDFDNECSGLISYVNVRNETDR